MCARSSQSLARAQAELGVERIYTDAETMLSDGAIDAVAVASPPYVQPAIAGLALSRSLPVFLEKMLAMSVEEARVLRDTAERTGVANVVDYIFPELQPWRACRSRLDQGFVGTPRHLNVRWMQESHDYRHALETWKTDPRLGGGALNHFGSHVLYYIEWLMGPIADLSCALGRAPDSGRPGDTSVSLSLQFVSGASGSVSLSTAAPFGSGHHVEVYGSDGALMLTNDSADPMRGFRLFAARRGDSGVTQVPTPTDADADPLIDARVEPVSHIATRFIDWIRTGQATRPSFREGLRVQILLEAAIRSHLDGSRVAIPAE